MDSTLRDIHDSVKGISRAHNEDKILILKSNQYRLFVLFDGLGSAKDAIEGVELAYKYISENHGRYLKSNNFELARLMYEVNEELLRSDLNEPYTTYVCLCISENQNVPDKYSHLGDSRLYGISRNYMHQYSKDDSASRHVVTKCLGMARLRRDDFQEHEIKVREFRYLLCSDGFYSLFEEDKKGFYQAMNLTYLSTLQRKLYKVIDKNNEDDSSYILIERDV